MKKHLLLLLLAFLVAAAAGCSYDDHTKIYKVTIADMEGDTHGVTEVKAVIGYSLSVEVPFDASGMTFRLPTRILGSQLYDINGSFDHPVSEPTAKWTDVRFFGYSGDSVVGYFELDVFEEKCRAVVTFAYVDRDVRIKGVSRDTGFNYDVDLTLQHGWNRYVVRQPLGEDRQDQPDISRNGVPQGARWRFIRHSTE